MAKLSRTTTAALSQADLDKGEISGVQLSTYRALAERKLVVWDSERASSTAGGRFPMFDGVQLTEAGEAAARAAKNASAFR